MTLSTTLSAALSGLGATSRAAQVVSSNLANAMNENYGRRELTLSAANQSFGGGVRVAGTRRVVDPVLLSDTRAAQANLSLQTEASTSLSKAEAIVGNVDNPASLSAHLRRFDAALSYAESNPAASVRLSEVAASAKAVTEAFGAAQADLRALRERADQSIARGVDTINDALQQIEALNENIVSAAVKGHDPSGYIDQRQALIDTVNEFVPVREMQRRHGAVSLVTTKGVILLDQTAAKISFEQTHTIMPHMTLQSGDLGMLKIGDIEFDLSRASDGLAGGRLEGLFQTRDVVSVDAQASLDGLAYEMADRFQDTSLDPTLGAIDAGLFTDRGNRVTSSSITGLAGRLELNARVDSDAGGADWRIRSGLNAATPGPIGDAQLLTGMKVALNANQPTSATGLTSQGSLLGLAEGIASDFAARSLNAERAQTNAGASHAQMQALMFEQGVDTDAEMQRLLMIETNYAANARVIQTVEAMLDELLRIGS